MGSCANGGGYYHYSYSVVRGCDSEYPNLIIAVNYSENVSQGLSRLIYMYLGALRHQKRSYMA